MRNISIFATKHECLYILNTRLQTVLSANKKEIMILATMNLYRKY